MFLLSARQLVSSGLLFAPLVEQLLNFRWSFDTALKLQAGAIVTSSLAKTGDTVTRMRQAGTLSCCICVCAQLHLIFFISAEATYPTAAESISIRRRDNATTPATGQALTQCQTQLNEATALHQQCLASGPLTPLQCECPLFFCQCSAGRIGASQSISRWATGASELEGSGIGLQRQVKDAR